MWLCCAADSAPSELENSYYNLMNKHLAVLRLELAL